MGHSFGAMLAMAYTSAHREHVGALVLSAPGGATLDFMQYYPASLSYRLTPDERAAAPHWSDARLAAPASRKIAYELIRASLGAFLNDRSHLDSALAALNENTWSLATSDLVWADLTRLDFDIRSPLREFDGPVLVIQGRQDALGDLHAFQIA
jgi:proline iminopeptidase